MAPWLCIGSSKTGNLARCTTTPRSTQFHTVIGSSSLQDSLGPSSHSFSTTFLSRPTPRYVITINSTTGERIPKEVSNIQQLQQKAAGFRSRSPKKRQRPERGTEARDLDGVGSERSGSEFEDHNERRKRRKNSRTSFKSTSVEDSSSLGICYTTTTPALGF